MPEKLERTDDPLAKAIEFLKPLQQLTTGIIETHLMTFEIYYRKNKLLIMLQALKRAYAIDPNNAVLHGCIIRFIKSMNKQLGEANEFVKIVIQKEIASELPILGKKPSQVNEEFLGRNRDNPAAIVAAARVIYDEMPEKNKTKAIELLKSCTNMKGLKLEVKLSATFCTCCKFFSQFFFSILSLALFLDGTRGPQLVEGRLLRRL